MTIEHHIACASRVAGGLEPCDCAEHDPRCPPESRCVVCWYGDDAVIKALVAERDDAERRAGDHAEEIVRLAAKCDSLRQLLQRQDRAIRDLGTDVAASVAAARLPNVY